MAKELRLVVERLEKTDTNQVEEERVIRMSENGSEDEEQEEEEGGGGDVSLHAVVDEDDPRSQAERDAAFELEKKNAMKLTRRRTVKKSVDVTSDDQPADSDASADPSPVQDEVPPVKVPKPRQKKNVVL